MFIKKKKIIEWLERSGVIQKHSFYGDSYYYPNDLSKQINSLEKKVDVLIDHLKLEYKPEHQCGPTLTKKEEE